jgi:acetylornithine deacetylase/succinyl-diaminopimelate desuccinylase-like protein
MTTTQDIRQAVHQTMPTTIDNLKQLVSIPSIATQGYPREQVLEAAHITGTQLKAAGFQQVHQLEGLAGSYPAVYGEIDGPPGAPTVLLYAHYDVQPSGQAQGWDSPPFEPTERNGRLYGRGAADNKSGVVAHIATIQAFEGRPPVGIKIIVEGDEEFGNSLTTYIPQHPDLFKADVIIIGDHGNITVGEPTLTTTLRGSASLTVEVRTLTDQVHNGVFGGPVPDALIALCQIIATFHDKKGNIQIPGLEPSDWQGADIPEEEFRRAANVLPNVALIGDSSLSAQLWAGYAINVIGLDAPSIAGASNSLIDTARARINLRVPPDQSAEHALALLIRHLESVTPWHAKITISDSHAGNGFVAKTDGPAYTAARQALKEAYNKDVQIIGDGASIPLTNILSEQFPQTEIIIWGVEDLAARIHGPNESVDLEELERVILTQALFLKRLAQK